MPAKRSMRTAARKAYVTAARGDRRLRSWSRRAFPHGLRAPHEVVEAFDSWAYLADLTEQVSQLLDDHHVEHLLLTERLLPQPRVVVRRGQADLVRHILRTDPRAATWWLAPSRDGLTGRAAPARRLIRPALGATGLVVSRNLLSPNGIPLTHSELGVLVDFWRELDGPESTSAGGELPSGTLTDSRHNGVLDYLGPELWGLAQVNGHRLPNARPHLLVVNEPVDLVYTWVDGDDPAWQARKAAALGGDPVDRYSSDAAITARFESRDELRYSLRSVEMFASWVRHIWIVTDQQAPVWLRQDDRLTLVDHTEIFSDPAALPVFNSHAIESQLHHIPGLAERYLYLNDDMLFGSIVRPEDFFHGNGVSKFFTSPALIDVGGHLSDDLAVTAAAKNNRDLIESQFGRTVSNKLRHTPQPQRRSVIEQFEADHPELFDRVMRSKFRQASDHSLPSSLSQYYAFARGKAVTGRIEHNYVDLASPGLEVALDRWLRRQDLQCFCVNDSGGGTPADAASRERLLREFFETYFPLPSRWELRPGH